MDDASWMIIENSFDVTLNDITKILLSQCYINTCTCHNICMYEGYAIISISIFTSYKWGMYWNRCLYQQSQKKGERNMETHVRKKLFLWVKTT